MTPRPTCDAVCRVGGTCRACGHRPPQPPPGVRWPNHGGDCPACGAGQAMRCGSPPMVGRERCRKHGGKSPRGAANAAFRSGRYSKWLPKDMRAGVERGLSDPQLTSHRGTIAVMEEMIRQLWVSLEDNSRLNLGREAEEAAVLVGGLVRGAVPRIQAAIRGNDPQAAWRLTGELLRLVADDGPHGRLLGLIRRGRTRQETEEKILDRMERAGRARDAEVRRMLALKQMLTLEEAKVFYRVVIDSLAQHTGNDKRLLALVIDDVERWSGGGGGPAQLPARAG